MLTLSIIGTMVLAEFSGAAVVTGLIFLLGLGFIAAVVLSIASKVFYVWEDPRIEEVEYYLAGANCGGCGYPGCSGCATAIVAGKAPVDACVVGGAESALAVAKVLGQVVAIKEPEVASPDCCGGTRATDKYNYEGATDCRAQMLLYDGSRDCPVGCLGLGSCVSACQFDAIRMGSNGYPAVNMDKCRACGMCAEACPKGVITLLNTNARLLHLNETTDCLAPCRQECPAQIDIPKYIEHIKNGEFEAAIQTMKERNPFLLACGRVCPRPCEDACRRQISDEPVGINFLKRYVADWEMNRGECVKIPVAPDTGKKVAVVGGGPAGLSCAFFLRRLGHGVKIFDMMPKLGGMFRYGIPEYRLPKKALDWDIKCMLDLGIDVEYETKFGKDFTVNDLKEKQGFDAVFLGLGAWISGSLRLKNEDAEGVIPCVEFLYRVGLGERPEVGKTVIVIGGGNVAVDVARTVNRFDGVEKVTMVVLESRKEMPAWDVEVEGALHEGIEIVNSVGPKDLPVKKGKVTGIVVMKCLRVFNDEGRFAPEFDEKDTTEFKSDSVILAIGQRPDASCWEGEEESCKVEVTRFNTIAVNTDTLQTKIPFVFSAGDIQTGPNLAVTAIGGGRRAARGIHYFMMEGEIPIPENMQRERLPSSLFETLEGITPRGRVEMPELPLDKRIKTFNEVDITISKEDAHHEASRCMKCGTLCYDPDLIGALCLEDGQKSKVEG